MPRHKLRWLTIFAIALAISILTTLGAIAKHEPSFYKQGQIPASDARREMANTCLTNFGQLMVNIRTRQPNWGCDVSEAQLNCFFEEAFEQTGEAENLRKIGISAPHIALGDNHVRIAFRYGSGWFSSVISYDLKIWLVPKEANVIAVEFTGARAGALPISNQSILQQLSELARKQGFKVDFYRHEGNPVAVLYLQPDQPHPSWLLTSVRVRSNSLSIGGKTLEHALAPPQLKNAS